MKQETKRLLRRTLCYLLPYKREFLVVGLTLVVLLSNRILDAIGERMYRVNEKMRMFGEDHHNLPDPPADYYYGKDEIGCLDRQFDRMAHQICDLIDKNYVSELLRKDAELETLEKQINPHFLYNTLESVNWRAKAIGETQISAMTEALGHLLHITLSKSTDIHTMKTELELVRYFMTIQNIRFEGQLDYAQTVDAKSENALIPKLTIQPLVENAYKYCDRKRPEIMIKGAVEPGGTWTVSVTDNGAGFRRPVAYLHDCQCYQRQECIAVPHRVRPYRQGERGD